ILARSADWWNLGWSHDGSEIWYAAPEAGMASHISSLQAVSLLGKRRLLLRYPGTFEFQDVARDGRVLFGRVSYRPQIVGLTPGETKERELSWLDGSQLADLSPDGRTILINENGEGGGPNASIYVRPTDGSPATLIGEGAGQTLSPDGRWILSTAQTSPRKLVLLPTGAGSPRPLEFEGLTGGAGGVFFPDGKSLLLVDSQPGQLPRAYVGSVEGGRPRPLGPPGLVPFSFGSAIGNPISPDGRFVFLIDSDKKTYVLPTGGGAPVPLTGFAEGEFPIQWSTDSRFLFTHRGGELPAKVWRYEIATGRKELLREIAPSDPAGVTSIEALLVTPDGRSFAYAYTHNLTDLYVVEGLR
ncbi:MAG: TolB family protein, partial [Thermoanaerobaculia bacterium]